MQCRCYISKQFYFNLIFEGRVYFCNLTSFTPLSAPPGGRICYPNQIKRVTRILPDLQTEQNSDKACHEDAKYRISFYLIFKGGVVFWNLTQFTPFKVTPPPPRVEFHIRTQFCSALAQWSYLPSVIEIKRKIKKRVILS